MELPWEVVVWAQSIENFSEIFTGPARTREVGMKIYINGTGHMTKMAAMPMYGKNLKISSSLETEVLLF